MAIALEKADYLLFRTLDRQSIIQRLGALFYPDFPAGFEGNLL